MRSVPIKVTLKRKGTYKHDDKEHCPRKAEFNNGVAAYALDLDAFYATLPCEGRQKNTTRALVLDGQGLRTTRTLVEKCNLLLANVDIVSKELVFETRAKTGQLWGGELSEFLERDHAPGKYDVVILDFCATWGPYTMECVELLFQKRLFDWLSVLAVTCAFRDNTGRYEEGIQYIMWMQCRVDIANMAHTYGYSVHFNNDHLRYDGMFVLYMKVVAHDAMRYDGGIVLARDGRTATDWMTAAVEMPLLFSKKRGRSE